MAYSLSPWLKPRFFITGTNRPLAGGLMYTYKAGTTENATTYSDDAGTPNTNPIVLDSDGQCDLFLDDAVSYRIILKNSAGVTQFDKDRIASLGSTQVQSFNSIAALRLRSGTTIANAAKTLGYYSAGDGGGNSFYWDGTSTATDNAGTVIKPTSVSGAGRWLAVDTSYINVKQFGAVGDGVADDTAAIQNALAAHAGLISGLGLTYKVTSKLTVGAGRRLHDLTLVAADAPAVSGDGIIEVSAADVEITEVTIDGGGFAHTGVKLDSASNVKIANISISDCTYSSIFAITSNDINIERGTFADCGGTYLGGTVEISGNCNRVLVKDCKITGAIGKGFVAYSCFDVQFINCRAYNSAYENFSPRQGARRVTLKNCVSIKDTSTGNEPSGVKNSRDAQFITYENCYFYQLSAVNVSAPFHSQGCSNIFVKNCHIEAGALTDQAVLLSYHPETNTPTDNVVFDNCMIIGAKAMGINADPAFSTTPLQNHVVRNCKINAKRPIQFDDVANATIENNLIYNSHGSTGVGILLTSTPSYTGPDRYSKVIGNEFRDWDGIYAIQLLNQVYNVVRDNEIKSLTGATAVIELTASTHCVIESNRITGAFTNAIRLQLNADKCFLIGNTIVGDGTGTGIRATTGAHYVAFNDVSAVGLIVTPLNAGAGSTVVGNTFAKQAWDSAAPTTRTWAVGDKVYNLAPTAGGFIGWVCVAAGTPGTWKTFGAISP